MSDPPPHEPFSSTPAGNEGQRRSQAHVQGWWRVTSALSEAESPQDVTRAVVHEGIQAMGADAGSVALPTPDGSALEIVAFSGYQASALEAWRTLPLDRHTPSTEVFQKRQPLFLETREQALLEYPALSSALSQFRGSLAVLPLVVRQEILGVLLLSFTQQRNFDAVDRTYLRSLAGQCAQALQRSTALQEAKRQGDQLAFLAEASEVLSRSLELNATLDTIARLTVPRLTDWCVIYLPDGERLLPVTVVHQDAGMVDFLRRFIERNPLYLSNQTGAGRVYSTGIPEVVPVITDEMYDAIEQTPEWKEDVRRLNLRSVISVPMYGRGRVVGVLGMARTSLERRYRQEDVTFALEVARRAGYAVENAHLYGQAQQEIAERKRAQQALDSANVLLEERVRERTRELEEVNGELEAFSYSASHDLRTPMRHIISFSEMLARRMNAPDASITAAAGTGQDDRSRMLLGQIQQAAARMNATLDGLLKLSRTSRVPLERTAVDLNLLVGEAIRDLAPDVQDRQIEWQIGPLPEVQGDQALLQLVIQNLLDNAVKYSQPRKHTVVSVFASEQHGAHHITVRDNGVGFDPRYAHKLFVAFQRLHHPGEFDGTGIGLANVRRIVSRHDGQIWAESVLGQGASFTFTLPSGLGAAAQP